MSKLHPLAVKNFCIWWERELFSESPCTDHAGISKALTHLHDVDGLSWPLIASLPFTGDVPQSTLNKIASTGKVPRKWQKYLRVKPDAPPRISISKRDDESAFNTLTKPSNDIPLSMLRRLNKRLTKWIQDQDDLRTLDEYYREFGHEEYRSNT